MGKFLTEFKQFAVKGNAIDMAVGVIIGGAFGKIVTSIVNDIIMPPIGWLIGGVDFKDLKWVMKEAAPEQLDEAGNVVQKAVAEVAAKLGDTGRILVRESGTEPVIRVMVEAPTQEICQEYVDFVVSEIRRKGHAV
jgi:hypothetical protein